MAASDANKMSSESLPSYYTYSGTYACSEHVTLMRQEWSDEGWFVESVQMLKTSGAYKVTVTYEKPGSDSASKYSFTETLWMGSKL